MDAAAAVDILSDCIQKCLFQYYIYINLHPSKRPERSGPGDAPLFAPNRRADGRMHEPTVSRDEWDGCDEGVGGMTA